MTRHLTRVATTALLSGLASLVLAGPADALLVHDPGLTTSTRTPAPVADDGGTPWLELGIGALGGLALAGAGTAATGRVRHRRSVPT